MSIQIEIQGLDPSQREIARDAAGKFMSRISKELRLPSHRSQAVLTFGPRSELPSDLSETRPPQEAPTPSDWLSPLLSKPRSNAALLRLNANLNDIIETTLARFNVYNTVYGDWGLNQIDPTPRLSLNFAGPPGTGKTLTAHYIAYRLSRNIVEVSYSSIVSKYFGQAAKNLTELFRFCQSSDAILFIDEAETLLSRRTSSGTDSADHTINSMRSEMLILLEKTPIISIMSTNMIDSYDKAFLSRMTTINFDLPDASDRERIWSAHIPPELPVRDSVTPAVLAARYTGINGREIVRSLIEAAFKAAVESRGHIELSDFDWAVSVVHRIGD